MPAASPSDLTVVIPTRDRWAILRRTLDRLAAQTVAGFEVVVVADGLDQSPPDLGSVRTIVKEHGGPGAARNAAVQATERPLLLFLGDDMLPVPELVERHLAVHDANPEREVAVLGHIDWHPEVAGTPVAGWLDRTDSQFDYRKIAGQAGQDVGFGRFFSSNVSLKRELFCAAGGFDEAFIYYYEDLDMGWRLHQLGMRLLYEPAARAEHLHRYDWAGLRRRFEGVALGERLMSEKHAWFTPWFRARMQAPSGSRLSDRLLPAAADRLGARLPSLPPRLREAADRAVQRRLAGPFMESWERAADLGELRRYLGDRYQPRMLIHHLREVDAEADSADDEATFYRTSEAYLYDLTVFAMSGTKDPYRAALRRVVPVGARLLDYGCGIGSDGLRFLADGYRVDFADFDNPSTRYLRWRLEQRGAASHIYDIERDEIAPGYDAAFSFDVIEHVEDPFAFLAGLESVAAVVAVNLLEPDPGETHLHRPLPIAELLRHAADRGLLTYRRLYGRSHLVIYRSSVQDGALGRARSQAALLEGRGRIALGTGLRTATRIARRLRD
jgi:glycosyltransferase involved in cell wall biosynthesis